MKIVWIFIEHGYARVQDRIESYGSLTELFNKEQELIQKVYPEVTESAFRRKIHNNCLNAGSFRMEKKEVKRSKHKK